jgi:selenocysteine lyase/cysteine desulfurase
VVSPFLPDDAKLHAVREALPAVGAGIYLNTAEAGPLPAETAAAMAEIADHELRFGRAHAADLEDAADRRDEARAAVAAVLAADVGSIALTRGSSEGVAIAVRGVDWAPGDRVVTISDAGAATESAVVGLRERRGVSVVRVPVPTASDDAGPLVTAVDDPSVRLVVLPHVTATGRLLPIADVADVIHAARPEVPIVVDGRLSVGAVPVVVDSLGVDAYAVAGEAWLLGPQATGGLWLSDKARRRLRPDLAGPDSLTPELERAADARAWEAGELGNAAVVGLARSAGWLSMFVGLDWVLPRATMLAQGLLARLVETRGVDLLTPNDPGMHAGVIVFRLAGWPSGEVVRELGARVFAIAGTVSMPGQATAVRLSLACFNEMAELERLADAITLLAGHTPESLPRRAALTILSG